MCGDASDAGPSGSRAATPGQAAASRRGFLTWGALTLAACASAGAALSTPPAHAAGDGSSPQAGAPTAQLRSPDPLGGAGFGAPTVMSVWAHYDDDLLFAGSRLDEALQAGHFVRTVFLTGGDAGRGDAYAEGRERGIRSAYDEMRGSDADWSCTQVVLETGARLASWQPVDSDRVTLIFFHLPDGNLQGQGFASTGYASLQKLAAGSIATIGDLAGTYTLSWQGIIDSVRALISRFAAATIITSVPGSSQQWSNGDHADHRMTGDITRTAWQQAGFPGDLVAYAVGYQTARLPANLSGTTLDRKIDAFRTYAAGDPVVGGCTNYQTCLHVPRFGDWLQRQYTRSEPELWTG